MQNNEIILQLLEKKCAQISVAPPPERRHDFSGLVAFRDDLSFKLNDSLEASAKLFDLAIEALNARFRFALRAHETQRGECETHCKEYRAIQIMGQTTNSPTGDVGICAMFVLRELNPALSQAAENPPSPTST